MNACSGVWMIEQNFLESTGPVSLQDTDKICPSSFHNECKKISDQS